jgi:hypothetical protein
VPSPHPNFKIHKTDIKNLQKSMEVRGSHDEEEDYLNKKGKQRLNNETVEIKKRKPS